MPRVSLCLALGLFLVAGTSLAKDLDCTDGGAVTGAGFGFMLSAPSGWCCYFKDAGDSAVRAMLVPEMSDPAAPAASIRVRVLFASDIGLDELWQAEIKRFKERFGDTYSAVWGRDMAFAGAGSARTMDLAAGGQGPRATVAIARQGSVYVVLTLAAEVADLHDWHLDGFRRFVRENILPMR